MIFCNAMLQTSNHTLSMVDTGPGGTTTNTETIFADNKIYVKVGSGWAASPLSQQKAAETTISMIRDAKVGACAHVRDEAVNGSAAAVYSFHLQNDDSEGDAQMWISKSQGVMLRYEATSVAEAMRVSMHYVFADVHAPAVN